ncbi:Probable galacturonosyltransferase 6 [Linum grandiflorum]
MKKARQRQRIIILCFLSATVFAPIVFLSNGATFLASFRTSGFAHDISSLKYRADSLELHTIEEADESLEEPNLIVYQEKDLKSIARSARFQEIITIERQKINICRLLRHHHQGQLERILWVLVFITWILAMVDVLLVVFVYTVHFGYQRSSRGRNARHASQKGTDRKIKEIQDKVIQAKVYLSLSPPGSNPHLVKQLRQRIKELERYSESTKDKDLPKSALRKMKVMEFALFKANRIYQNCVDISRKLRAMTYTAEEQVRAHKDEASYLVRLAARSTPKGYHCLSLRLTAEYFAMSPDERQFPNQHRLHDPDLHHYAVFSNNILACAVVVNSTVSSARDKGKIVFHVVTNALNFPAISMWFLLYPPGKATIYVESIDKFEGLTANYNWILTKQNSSDPRYTSDLNHLRFYLPDVFPKLKKIVLLDHDVVVRRDLAGLWSLDLKGKVNAAVETCHDENDPSFRRMDMLINFSDPYVARKFDAGACTWAFGMNLFDLKEWRRRALTAVYHKYLRMGSKRRVWKSGSLPLGWATFYNRTIGIDRRWHRLGLGYESEGMDDDDNEKEDDDDGIEEAAVLHYDGVMKPWLDIGISKYRRYWTAFLNYDNPHFQQCNIHE